MKNVLAIELGSHYLKMALVRFKGGEPVLESSFFKAISTEKETELIPFITEFVKTNKYKARLVKVSLPRNFVTVRNLHLPSNDEEEINKMISLHITRIVPHKIEEVAFSYRISGKDSIGHQRITLAVAHNELMKRQLNLLHNCGLLVDQITLSSHCVWEYIRKTFKGELSPQELHMIFDIDLNFADLMIFNKDDLLFSRSVSLKDQETFSDSGMKRLLGEVRQAFLIFQNEEINMKPKKIFLCGAGTPALAEMIARELEIPTQYVPPPFKSKPWPAAEGKSELSLSWTAVLNIVTLGEDLGGLSFMLPELQIRKALRDKIRDLALVGTSVTCILFLSCVLFLSKIYNHQSYLAKLTAYSLEVGRQNGPLVDQLDRVKFARDYLAERKVHLFTISQLQKVMSPPMALTALSLNEDNEVTLKGRVLELSDVFNFVSELERNKQFKDVQTKYTRKGRWKDQDVTDFQITFVLETTADHRKLKNGDEKSQ